MLRLELSDDEIKSVRSLIRDVAAEYDCVENINFLNNACLYAHELPRRVRSFLNDFRLKEPPSGFCILKLFFNKGSTASNLSAYRRRFSSTCSSSFHAAIEACCTDRLIAEP